MVYAAIVGDQYHVLIVGSVPSLPCAPTFTSLY